MGSRDGSNADMWQARDQGDLSAGAYSNMINNPTAHNPGHYGGFNPNAIGGGSHAGNGNAVNDFFKALTGVGADPSVLADLMGNIGSGPTGHGLAIDDWHKMFANDHWKAPRIGGGQSTGSTGGAMMMSPTPQGQGAGPQSQDRLDYEAFRDRNRRLADQRAEMDLHQKFAQQLFGSLGIGGQVHSSGTSQEIFNNAGRPLPVTLNSTQTRDITPQEKASLLQAILGGM